MTTLAALLLLSLAGGAHAGVVRVPLRKASYTGAARLAAASGGDEPKHAVQLNDFLDAQARGAGSADTPAAQLSFAPARNTG